jgi:hypothetical protein
MRSIAARALLGFMLASAAAAGVQFSRVDQVHATVEIKERAEETATDVPGTRTLNLPFAGKNLAVHWQGETEAHVQVAFSRDGVDFSAPIPVQRDEVGEQRHNGETYGSVMSIPEGAAVVRIFSDRHLGRLAILETADGQRILHYERGEHAASAAVPQPPVIARAGWGADESLMTWAPEFHPIQKLIVHHTATSNNDPDPAATIRSIYYYHAVTQAWGDIGYNFLIDEQGRLYEGRHSRTYGSAELPTGEDVSGNGVTGAHAAQFNSGTVGVALLGTLTNQDATPAAKDTLEKFLAWKASGHGISPTGNSTYVNPVTGVASTFPNIAGHRDVNATECPGGVLYASLPRIRQHTAALVAGSGSPSPAMTPSPTNSPAATPAPTASPTPSSKATPNPTPVAPATPTPSPTRTPTPPPTPSASPTLAPAGDCNNC